MANSPIQKKTDLFIDAIKTEYTVKFHYKDSDRTVQPWLVGVQKETEYLVGFQTGGGSSFGLRKFNIDEISNISLGDKMTVFPKKLADAKKWSSILCETRVEEEDEEDDN